MTKIANIAVLAAAASVSFGAAAQQSGTSLSDEQIVAKYCTNSPRGRFVVEDARVPTIVYCSRGEVRPMDPKTACQSFEVGIADYDPRTKNVQNPAWSTMTLGEVYEQNRKAHARYCAPATSWKFSPYSAGMKIG